MINDYVAIQFKAAPGRWITVAGEKKLIPLADHYWKNIKWWHTKATSRKEAILLISQSIAATYKWKYAALIDVTLEEAI